MGVSYEQGRYRARITENGRRKTVGYFDTKRKAQLAIERYRSDIRLGQDMQMLHKKIYTPIEWEQPFFQVKPTLRKKVQTWLKRLRVN